MIRMVKETPSDTASTRIQRKVTKDVEGMLGMLGYRVDTGKLNVALI
jgi:hypothetical protein